LRDKPKQYSSGETILISIVLEVRNNDRGSEGRTEYLHEQNIVSAVVIATCNMLYWIDQLERNSFKLSSLRISLSFSDSSIISCAFWSFCAFHDRQPISFLLPFFLLKILLCFLLYFPFNFLSILLLFNPLHFLTIFIPGRFCTSTSSRLLFVAVELVCTFRRGDSKTASTIISALFHKSADVSLGNIQNTFSYFIYSILL